jgi:hypothetical protein
MRSGTAADWLDGDGYPTEDALVRIELWSAMDIDACLQFVKSLWYYPQYVRVSNTPKAKRYRFAAAGWSGNESLVSAMEANLALRGACWVSSHRGGVHVYDVPKAWINNANQTKATPKGRP